MMNPFIFNSSNFFIPISLVSKRSRLAKIAAPFFALCTLFAVAAILSIGTNAANAVSAQTASAPHFTGHAIPEPPEQHAPWKAPVAKAKNLDPHFVKAAEILFRQGLADPRGCEYREITIVVGSLFGENPLINYGEIVKTHGWVLPLAKHANGDLHSGKKQPQRFAIAWNGLVYPTLAVGEKADVDRFIKKTIAFFDSQKEKQDSTPHTLIISEGKAVGTGTAPLREHGYDASRFSNGERMPIRAALLLRLGKTSLAEKLWKTWIRGTEFEKNPKTKTTAAIYQRLATYWLFSQLNRADCAQMRGDDNLALVTLRKLAPLQKVAKDELTSLDKTPYPKKKPAWELPPFSFLDQVKALLADQKRRADEPNRKIRSLTAIKKIPNQSKRIAALIEHLDQIYAQQESQPGGVEFGDNPTVLALIHEGDAAVEPLLLCLESDPRFTRSVYFWRDFSTSRIVLSVCRPAYAALTAILHKTFFTYNSTWRDLTTSGWSGREKVAAAIRAYWKKYKELPLVERWFSTLANDEATPNDWVQAAQNIVQPDNKGIIPSKAKFANRQPVKMAGESLRSKTNPNVSELLEKRIRGLAGKPSNQTDDNAMLSLNEVLIRWDGKANLKNLSWFSSVLTKRALTAKGYYKETWIEYLSRLCLQRMKLGDPDALKEYTEIFKQWRPAKDDNSWPDDGVLALTKSIWKNPANRDVQAAVKWAFTNPQSPWLKAFAARKNWRVVGDFLTTPLIAMPTVRAFVLRQLANKNDAGAWKKITVMGFVFSLMASR